MQAPLAELKFLMDLLFVGSLEEQAVMVNTRAAASTPFKNLITVYSPLLL